MKKTLVYLLIEIALELAAFACVKATERPYCMKGEKPKKKCEHHIHRKPDREWKGWLNGWWEGTRITCCHCDLNYLAVD